jgi:hypothetical protein
MLVALEVHPRVAMQILRHSQIAVTMNVHSEVSSVETREALRRLGDQLGEGGSCREPGTECYAAHGPCSPANDGCLHGHLEAVAGRCRIARAVAVAQLQYFAAVQARKRPFGSCPKGL